MMISFFNDTNVETFLEIIYDINHKLLKMIGFRMKINSQIKLILKITLSSQKNPLTCLTNQESLINK